MASLIGKARAKGAIGLMGHVIADYPSPGAVRQMIEAMAAAGASIIEIQIPFSEPMADGPFFLAANHRALAQGVDYAASMKLMREVSAAYPQVSFIFMSYLNVIYQRGYEAFAAEAAAHGAAGVIVPDLPLEYAQRLEEAGLPTGFANVRILAPNATPQRLGELTRGARGLLYVVARAGVTGSATDLAQAYDFIKQVKGITEVPVAVGFGVRSGADVRALVGHADYAIIGTASLQAYEAGGLKAFRDLWQELAQGAT